LLSKGKGVAGKVAGAATGLGAKVLGGAKALGSKAVGFANTGAGKLLGSTAAVGLGAYTAYSGYSAAEDSKQSKLKDLQAQVDAGQISPEEAAVQRKEIGNSATVEKSEAVGEGTGVAAGAIAGAKLGATAGTFIGGPVGTVVGGLAGGALGAFTGSKAGKVVGEYSGRAINSIGEGLTKAGKTAEQAFKENVAPVIDPVRAGVTKEQAQAALESGSPRDIEKLGGRNALMKLAGNAPIAGVSTEQAQTARSNYASVEPRRIDTPIGSQTARSNYASVDPRRVDTSSAAGVTVAKTSTDNADMTREAGGRGGANNTIVSNNVSSNNSTRIVPMKASPRPEFTGSSLDRYTSRITVY
jgi:hypothetical protein